MPNGTVIDLFAPEAAIDQQHQAAFRYVRSGRPDGTCGPVTQSVPRARGRPIRR